jgi:hypothetical protein
MEFMIVFEEIMAAYSCDLNQAMQMYQRGTTWES